jgi:RNA polymerase sigma-70 factor (ECF subfamily)
VATLPDLLVALSLAKAPRAGRAAAAAATEADLEAQRFTRLYDEHAPRVHRFLRDLLRDEALAADAVQETFTRVYRQMATLHEREPLAAWIFGVARNVSLEVRRARGRAARAIDASTGVDARRSPCTPEAELLDREALEVVDAALDRLSEERRAALLLRLDHGLAYEEIARVMGWSLAKAKVEVFRAREVLRATYAEYTR